MRKFGRSVDHGDSYRLCDVVAVPDTVENPEAWLRVMYAPHVEEWTAKGEWFIAIPDDILPDGQDLVSGHPVVNGKVLPLPKPGECVVEIAAKAGCPKAQAQVAKDALAASEAAANLVS